MVTGYWLLVYYLLTVFSLCCCFLDNIKNDQQKARFQSTKHSGPFRQAAGDQLYLTAKPSPKSRPETLSLSLWQHIRSVAKQVLTGYCSAQVSETRLKHISGSHPSDTAGFMLSEHFQKIYRQTNDWTLHTQKIKNLFSEQQPSRSSFYFHLCSFLCPTENRFPAWNNNNKYKTEAIPILPKNHFNLDQRQMRYKFQRPKCTCCYQFDDYINNTE